ncbi:MAG: AtpZ/AtpI family protein [Pseudomonadota bacterium]
MTKDEPPSALDDLGNRIRKAKDARLGEEPGAPNPSPAGQTLRLAVEMASVLFVGAAMGWALDRWLGTGPWLLLIFLLLGSAGGLLNAYRTGRRLNAQPEEEERRPGEESGK